MKITLEQKHIRAASVAVGVWLVLSGVGLLPARQTTWL
jgi:hypothetical protein